MERRPCLEDRGVRSMAYPTPPTVFLTTNFTHMNRFRILGAFLALFLLTIGCEKDRDLDLGQTPNEEVFTVSPHFTITEPESVEIAEKYCESEEHQAHLLKDDTYRKAHQQNMRNLQQRLATNPSQDRNNCSDPLIIPVAVHFQDASASNLACLRTLAVNQIKRLNEDFRGTNGDITKWKNGSSSYFPGVNNGDVCVEFRIADQNHPSGTGLRNGDLAVTAGANTGDRVSTWSGYINIFVRDLNQGNTTGYSPIGGRGNGDGVIIDDNAFGSGTGCPGSRPHSYLRYGRTIVHELGHYFTLDHIWGNGCGSDDGVSDTPDQSGYNLGCPSLGKQSCGSTDMFMNYMDYSSESCSYMFSAGQATRMANYVNNYLKPRLKKASNVISGANDGGGSTGGDTNEDCISPNELSAVKTGADNAKFSWNHVNVADRYQFRLKAQGYSGWSTYTTSGNEVTYRGLQANITYEFQVRSLCFTGEWSPFSDLETFSLADGQGSGGGTDSGNDGNGNTGTDTEGGDTNSGGGDTNDDGNTSNETCDAPENVMATQLNSKTITLSWDAVAKSKEYQLQIRSKGFNFWYKFIVPYTSIQLNGVRAGRTYEYQVRTKCEDGSWTDFSDLDEITID